MLLEAAIAHLDRPVPKGGIAVVRGLLRAAASAGVPLGLLDIDADGIPDAYRHALVLSRPDQHVAWRADEPPKNAGALIDLIRGAAP